MGTLLEFQALGEVLTGEALSRRVGEQVEQLARRRCELGVQPGGLVGIFCRPGTGLTVMPRSARAATRTSTERERGPGLGRQESPEPRVELGYALLWDGDRDLFVGHQTALIPAVCSAASPCSVASRRRAQPRPWTALCGLPYRPLGPRPGRPARKRAKNAWNSAIRSSGTSTVTCWYFVLVVSGFDSMVYSCSCLQAKHSRCKYLSKEAGRPPPLASAYGCACGGSTA